MKLHLVDLWQCRVQYLRPYYASWKPRQRDHPISSPHVWYLPLVWTCWCTAMTAIILLALNVEDMMETVSAVQNLKFALYINSPLIVIWWHFAVMMSERDSNSRYYKSKQRYCNCSICSHRWLRNGCVLTRLAKQGLPVTMVIPPLKQKCCQKRRVKFILHSADNPRVISILLMLAGDVESNPGPDYQEYVSVLPRSSCSCLKETLDWDNGGVDKDLTDIAAHLLDWEVKLSVPFGFTQSEIDDLKEEHSKTPILLRRAVLRLWKEKQGLHATYEKLLKMCCEAGATTVAQAICEVLKQRAKDCCVKGAVSPSVKYQDQDSKEESDSLPREVGTQCADSEPDGGDVVKFPAFPQGDPREMYFALLKSQTKEIKIHYCHFSQSFMENFLKREKKGEVNFYNLFIPASDLFEINNDDFLNDPNSEKLLQQILLRQSYMNFDLLKALITETKCGSKEDVEEAQKYTEAFTEYAKRRVFECDPDLISSDLPGLDMVMFVLDKDQSFRLIDAKEFTVNLSKMLGMKYQNIIVHKFEPGSVAVFVLIPSGYIRALTMTPLYHDRVLTLKKWDTRCINFRNQTQGQIRLNHLNVFDSVNFNKESILQEKMIKIVPVEIEGEKCMALEYTEVFSDEHTADTGYIDYMESLLCGKHRNIPAVKGVYYHSGSEGKNQYPTIVVEELKLLKDAMVEEKMSQVNQVSVLLDVASSVASFKSDTFKYKVSVLTDAIFVHENPSEIQARFCPLYGYSFLSGQTETTSHISLPLEELQWMNDMVKLIHFQGKATEQTELPENHILKKMFDQKWLSEDDRFRPLNFKILTEEIQHLLETEKTWIGLVASFSDDLVEDEVQIHLILIGHTGVGKTSVRKHLKDEPIDMNESPTIIMEPEFLYRESIELTTGNPFKCIKDAVKCANSKVFLTMWDTGGQPIFQDLLPCFARLKVMYGIVFRLPDLQRFNSKPEIRACDAHHESVTSPFTNEDILYRNLAYVQAYSCSMKEKFECLPFQAKLGKEQSDSAQFPAAVVVGTCKDVPVEFDEHTMSEMKLNLDQGISDFVQNNTISVYPVPSVSSYIHEIDNTVSGKSLDEGISHLRDNISRCAQESNTKVHKSWKIFELRLKRLAYTKYVNLGIVPLIEAITLGKECKVDNPKAALMYFHELGVFMWYHISERESMKSFVVIDPKTLLQILSKLFCFNPSSIPLNLKQLIDKGILTIDFFINLLKQKASNIDDSWFMGFLEEHHLSVKLVHPRKDICYFLPSLLPIKPDYENNLDDFTDRSLISPLYIVPQSGYIPTGMFTRLLTALAGVTYGSTVWRIPLDDNHLPDVCRNQFEFVINNSLHLILSEFSKHIRIDCIPYKNSKIEDDLYFRIASTVDVQLQRIVPRWMEEREFSFTFACQNVSCALGNKLHFFSDKDLIFKSNKIGTCSNGLKKLLLSSELIWRRNQTNSNTGEASTIFQEALKGGFLDISTTSLMFVGIQSPGSTSAKHVVFQEAVPTIYKPTLLINHEIYFRAEGDPTLKKIQPDICNDVMLMSHCLCTNQEKPAVVDRATPPESVLGPSLPKPTNFLPRKKQRAYFLDLLLPSNTPSISPPAAIPTGTVKPAVPAVMSSKKDDQTVVPLQQEQSVKENTVSVQAILKGTPVGSKDRKLDEIAVDYLATNTTKVTGDVKKILLQCANTDNFTKYMTQFRDKGKIEFFHVYDCGSHFLQMREILKIFIKNVSLCALVTDSFQQKESGLLQENKGFASKGLIIGTHNNFQCSEMKRLRDTGFMTNVFTINCKQPERSDYESANRIIDHASLLATVKKFPFAWYLFGFKLQQVMANLNQSTLSVSDECMVIAAELNMDRPTVEAALEYLTEQNMILYFGNILNNSVFSGINVFSQIFSRIYSDKCSQIDDQCTWKLSIITESHLKAVVEYVADRNVSVADFIMLLKKLLILAPYDGAHASYLMPCLLPTLSETKVDELHKSTESFSVPACIKCPSTGYEYISMLAIYLLTQTNYDWTISLDLFGAPACLYKNCYKFLVESSQSLVNLSFVDDYLKITISCLNIKPVKVREIGITILRGLEKIKIILNIDKMFDFDISFFCPCGSCDKHTGTYNRDQKTITCDIQHEEVPFEDFISIKKWLHEDEHFGNQDVLTVPNIVKRLVGLSEKWIHVAELLGVPSAVINTISVITTHQQSEDTALYKVVEWWFMNTPNPEWAAIDRVIVENDKENVVGHKKPHKPYTEEFQHWGMTQPTPSLPTAYSYQSNSPGSYQSTLSYQKRLDAKGPRRSSFHSQVSQSPSDSVSDQVLLTVMNCLMHNKNCEILNCPCKQIQDRYIHLKASTVPLEQNKNSERIIRRKSCTATSTESSDSGISTFDSDSAEVQLNLSNRLHPHYHINTRFHIRKSTSSFVKDNRRRSRSMSDLTPISEFREILTPQVGGAIKAGTPICDDRYLGDEDFHLTKEDLLTPQRITTSLRLRVHPPLLRDLSLSSDNLPMLCLNDCLLQLKTPKPISNLSKHVLKPVHEICGTQTDNSNTSSRSNSPSPENEANILGQSNYDEGIDCSYARNFPKIGESSGYESLPDFVITHGRDVRSRTRDHVDPSSRRSHRSQSRSQSPFETMTTVSCDGVVIKTTEC